MARDSKQFDRCIQNWEALRDHQAFSVPENIGRTAILCSYVAFSIKADEKNPVSAATKDIRIFRNEAFNLADILQANGAHAEVILNAGANDFQAVLKDPGFSDVITIGHGTLTKINCLADGDYNAFGWTDVSKAADHLKLGNFVQRHCGMYGGRMAVPYGAFAMSDHRKVWAPVGKYFAPRGLLHNHNTQLVPVSEKVRLTYADVTSHEWISSGPLT